MKIRIYALSAAMLLSMTACKSDNPRSPIAVESTKPAPLPTEDWTRKACHTLPADMLAQLEDLANMRLAADYAVKSSDYHVAAAGDDIISAITDHDNAELRGDRFAVVDANLALSQAGLGMAQACADQYGDGPW